MFALGIGIGASAACSSEAPPIQIVDGGSGGETGTGGGGGEGIVTEGTISESSASEYETDPQLAASGDVIAVVWTSRVSPDSSPSIGYAISTNGGVSFSDPQQIASPDFDHFQAPDVEVDNGGNVYLTFLGHARSGTGGAAIYYATTNGGTAFTDPEPVTDTTMVSFFGRPRLTLTNTNRIVLAYTETVGNGTELRVATREQTGSMWTINNMINGGQGNNEPTLCAAANTPMGRTYLVTIAQGRVNLRRSEDNGDMWQGIQASADGDQIAGPASCVAVGTNVWVSYGVRGAAGLSEIKVAHSSDGGETIANVGVVSDPDIRAVHAVHQVTAQPPETAHAVYYNGSGLGDETATFRRVRFTPDNLMQMPPLDPMDPPLGMPSVLVQEPMSLQLISDDRRWLGSGVGIDFEDGKMLLAFVDNSSGNSHIAFKAVTP